MKTRIGRKSLALIAVTCSLAGCTRSEAPATPAEGPSAAATGEPTAGATGGVITTGIYDVCDVADTDAHDHFTGDHLTGKKVEIRRIDAKDATAVCIGKDGCPDDLFDPQFDGTVLWMIGNENLLRAVHPFEHDVTADTRKTTLPHLLRIQKQPTDEPIAGCNKDNVLLLQICWPRIPPSADSNWQCRAPEPHGADAHIEN